MKRLLLLGVGSALMFTMGGVGSAQADTSGPAHKSTSVAAGGSAAVGVGGRCANCHRAHTAKAENLLMQAQPALCYTCHNASGTALDVVDGVDANGTVAAGNRALRGGGFSYALINGTTASLTVSADGVKTPYVPVGAATPVTSRHQIDGTTTGTMWGNGAISTSVNPGAIKDKDGVSIKLECGSCHDPHGNGNYRILKPVPSQAGTAQKVMTAATATTAAVYAVPGDTGYVANGIIPVNIPDAVDKVYTTTDYWKVADRQVPTVTGGPLTAIGTGTTAVAGSTIYSTDGNGYLIGQGGTDGFITNIAAWCTTCHTRYLAQSPAYKTDSTDAVFTYRHTSNKTNKEGVSRPNCIQCHVSHGSNVAMDGVGTVLAPDGQAPTAMGTPSTVGTSRLLRVDNRGTCQMCHNK